VVGAASQFRVEIPGIERGSQLFETNKLRSARRSCDADANGGPPRDEFCD